MASDKDFLQGLLRLVNHPDLADGLRVRDPKLVNYGLGSLRALPDEGVFAVKFPIEALPKRYPANAFVVGALAMQLTDIDRLRAAIERIGTTPVVSSYRAGDDDIALPRRGARRAPEAAAPRAAAPVSFAKPIVGQAAPERRPMQSVRAPEESTGFQQFREGEQAARVAGGSGRRTPRAETKFGAFPENASIETIAAAMRRDKRILAFTFANRQLGLVFELMPIAKENHRKLIAEIAMFDAEARKKFERDLEAFRRDLADFDGGTLADKPKFPTPPTSILIAEVSDGSRRVVNLQTQQFEDPRKKPTEWASARLAAILDKVPKIRPLPGAKEASEAYELRKGLEAAGERFAGPGGRMYESRDLTARLERDPEFAAQYRYRGAKSGIQIRTEMAQRMGVGETTDSAASRLARLGVPVTEREIKAVEQTVRLLLGEEVTDTLVGAEGALPGGGRLKKGETPTGSILVGVDGYAYVGGTSKKYPDIAQARTLLRLHGFKDPSVYFAEDLLEEGEYMGDEPEGRAVTFTGDDEIELPRRKR